MKTEKRKNNDIHKLIYFKAWYPLSRTDLQEFEV